MASFARSLVKCALLAALVSLSLGNKRVSEIGVEGESVLMTCDLPLADPPVVEWKDWVYNSARTAIPIGDKDGNINSEHPQKDNFEVDIVKHQLTIKNFKKEDAGDYICESKINGEVLMKTITLSFVGALKCVGKTDLQQGDTADLVCEVAYHGSQLPRPEWIRPKVISEGLDFETRDEILMARRAVIFTVQPDMNGATFTCQIKVGEKVLQTKCDRTLSVKYAVNNVEIEPESPTYHAGEKIKCTANGNPAPKMMWKPEPKEVESGVGFQIMTVPDRSEDDKPMTYTCTASSHLGDEVEIVDKTITFKVLGSKRPPVDKEKEPTAAPTTGGASVGGIIIGLIVGLLILIIIIVAVVCVLRGRRSKQPKGSKPVPSSDAEYGREMDGKGANSNNVKYEDEVEKKPAETPENNLPTSEDPKEKNVEGLDYTDLQFDDNMELSPQPPLSSSDEITYVKV